MTRLAGLLCWMIQWCLTDSTLATTAIIIIITAFILSRLDYCNAVLAGLPKVTFVPLQQAQNAVMRLILCLAPHDHVTSALRVIQKWALCKYTYLYLSLFTALCHLHWLPVQYRIFYKLYLCTSSISTRHHPISKTFSLRQHQSVLMDTGRLRSASSFRYEQPWMRLKFGQCCFSYAAPAAWNTVPPSLQQLTNTDSFKRQLKTVLFERAFS